MIRKSDIELSHNAITATRRHRSSNRARLHVIEWPRLSGRTSPAGGSPEVATTGELLATHSSTYMPVRPHRLPRLPCPWECTCGCMCSTIGPRASSASLSSPLLQVAFAPKQ